MGYFFFNCKLWCHFCCSVTQSCPTVCDPMDCSTPGFPVLHLEFTQTHVLWVGDAIQHLILCQPLLLLLSIFPSIGVFSNESALWIRWTNYSVSSSVLPMNIHGRYPLELIGSISLQSKWPSRVFSDTTVWKHQFFGTLFLLDIKRDSTVNTKESICGALSTNLPRLHDIQRPSFKKIKNTVLPCGHRFGQPFHTQKKEKKNTQMSNNYIKKKPSASLAIREMKIKTSRRYTGIRFTERKASENTKYLSECCWATTLTYRWWEYKLIFLKTACQQQLKLIHLPCYQAMSFLDRSLEEICAYAYKKYTKLFTAAWFAMFSN